MEASIPRRRGRRRWLLLAIVAIGLLLLILSGLSGFYIDVLWFREVEFSSVFWTVLRTRVLLVLVFGLIFFALLYANLLIARALRPRYQVYSPAEEAVDRYRSVIEPYAKWILPGLAALFAIFAAVGVAGQWEIFQQWRVSGSVSFGVVDPVFDRDVSFYVLALPFLQFVQGWLFTSLVVVTVVTTAAHYLWGGIRFRAVGERVTPQVKAHLSVLLALIVLVKAWGYWLGRFDLLTSPRGTVTGASYTDVNAQLPALWLLFGISLAVTILFLINIRFRGWAIPAVGLGLLVLTSVVAGAIYPAAVQRFSVTPQELQREDEYIDRNIEFTRRAFGLDQVEAEDFPAEPQVTAAEVEQYSRVVDEIRLWNPLVLRQSYQQLQRIRPYYEFLDVDVDRYEIGGERRLVMLSPREITQDGIRGGGQTWQNRHLVYTHGYAAAASQADEATTEGGPSFILSDIPMNGALVGDLDQPRVYFQESADVPFVVVGTEEDELDFPTNGEQFARTRYDGTGGIQMSNFIRRLAFAWNFRDVNLLISGLIGSDSKILINTDLENRVRKIAPFLAYDHDPYAAIVDGHQVWIWDAYTTTDLYPYSEIVSLEVASNGALTGRANYIRNSVKVVVDAYDGTTTFYLVDESDPIIQAWAKIFPDLFTPLSEASDDLQAHFRYPEDLFRVQAFQFGNYHVTDSSQFYAKEDFWSIPVVAQDPTAQPAPLDPYYVLMPLPGEEEAGERFVLFTPFTPAERPNMVAWMAAVSDPDEYGRMVALEFPLERNVPGPENVAAFIAQDTEISREVSLFDQLGSRVVYGDLLAIPIGQSFLYVQPLYLISEQAGSSVPELKRVVVVNGEQANVGETLEEAISVAFAGGEAPPEVPVEPTEPAEPTPPEAPLSQDVLDLLTEAESHFDSAQEALQAGDLAGYQAEIDAAQEAIRQAATLAGQ